MQLEGKRLGAYTMQQMLGQGGMAQVYKAYHERLQREVAIKVIQPDRAGLADFRVSFEQEARLIASLQHPNIVTVYDFGQQEDLLYLVMQYVAGGTLRDQIKAGPLEPRRAALYTLQMARALHHAHQRDIVHRDVKPLNMLVSATNRNNVLLSDFGLAEIFAARTETHFITGVPEGNDQALSHIGDNIVGTPRYMAPEQCLGKPVDARTDIYALGAVLFELLTGLPPFRGETLYSLMRMHVYQPAPSIQEINPAVPELLIKITARALEKAPEDRFQSAKEMGLQLENFLTASPANITTSAITATVPVQAPPLPVIAPPRKKRNLLPYYVTIALFVLLTSAQFFVSRGYLHLPGTSSAGSTSAVSATGDSGCAAKPAAQLAQPFSENFQDNRRNWQLVGANGITPGIGNNTYTLSIADTKSSFFLCPDAASIGTLPTNFSLTARMAQKQGSSDVYYGLAFRLGYNNGSGKVSGYAFEINGQGECVILKYDPQEPNGYTILQAGSNASVIHKSDYNMLQVVVRGSQFSFKVNNTPVSFNGSEQVKQGISDTAYKGGQPGLIVSGPDTQFVVSAVTLTIP
jgi:serine/threonine protein kinase